MIDLIVRGDERDIAVEDGVIARIAPEIAEPARTLLRGRSGRHGRLLVPEKRGT